MSSETSGEIEALAEREYEYGFVTDIEEERAPKGLSEEERADLTDVAAELVEPATAEPVGLFDRTAKGLIDAIRERHRPGSDVDELALRRKRSSVKR